MTDEAFFGLAILLWILCAVYAARAGFRRNWWALLLSPLAFALGFFALMLLMAQLARDDLPSDLAWLGFAPYFAAPFVPPLPILFGLGLLVSVLRNRLRSEP